MKTVVLLSCFALSLAAAPAAPPLPSPAPNPPPPVKLAELNEEIVIADEQPGLDHVAEQVRRQMQQVEMQLAQTDGARSYGGFGGGYGNPPPPPAPGVPGWSGQGPGSQVLILPSGDMDAEQQKELGEDLAVMSRVLERAASEESGRRPRAMGMDLTFFAEARPARVVYLGDYGVVFNLQAPFPLLAPPPAPKSAGNEPTAPEDAEWEAARRDLYGGNSPAGLIAPELPDVMLRRYGLGRRAGPEFDQATVDKLRQSLLGALRHAARIRHLKEDDFVLLIVRAPAADVGASGETRRSHEVRHEVNVHSTGNGADAVVWTSEGASPAGGSMMTLRVRWSDAEALAQGSIDLDELERRAMIRTVPTAAPGAGWSGF